MTSPCCEPNGTNGRSAAEEEIDVTRSDVQQFYARAGATPQPSLCCPTLYTKDQISHIPEEVMAVSYGCGSPVVLAGPKPGDIHVDLGSGGGIDCFIASKAVGKAG